MSLQPATLQDRFDEIVLPQLLHQMSQEADPVFKQHLTNCLDTLLADSTLEGECHLKAGNSSLNWLVGPCCFKVTWINLS